jgi:hypothetical protein
MGAFLGLFLLGTTIWAAITYIPQVLKYLGFSHLRLSRTPKLDVVLAAMRQSSRVTSESG